MVTKRIHLRDSQETLALVGPQDQQLRRLEQSLSVQIFARGHILAIRGAPGRVEKAILAIEDLRLRMNQMPDENTSLESDENPSSLPNAIAYASPLGKTVHAKTANQKQYVEAIDRSDLVIAIGPAGTGKTYLSVACALAALKAGQVNKIVLTRPVVEAGEKLGYLPGDFYDKVDPYLKPLYDAFYSMLGPDRFRLYRDEETIEIVPLAYMRGRTLEKAFIILDEGQNATPEQMKMFLTRMGKGSKVVVNGDITQVDLPDRKNSGLYSLPHVLKDVLGVEFIFFTEIDVVRHPLVRSIILAYTQWEKKR